MRTELEAVRRVEGLDGCGAGVSAAPAVAARLHLGLVSRQRLVEQGAQLLRVALLAQCAQIAQHLAQAYALQGDKGIFVAPPAVGTDEELQFAAVHEFGLIANGEPMFASFAGDSERLSWLAGCVHSPIVARMGGGFYG